MLYLATTRGRRFTKRTVEKLCGLDANQSRLLKYFKEVDVTEDQAQLLEHHKLALPVKTDKPKPKTKTKTNTRRTDIKEDADAL